VREPGRLSFVLPAQKSYTFPVTVSTCYGLEGSAFFWFVILRVRFAGGLIAGAGPFTLAKD
jgi:hypothetical protein